MTLNPTAKSSPLSIGVEGNTVYWTEVAFDSPKLLFNTQVEESGNKEEALGQQLVAPVRHGEGCLRAWRTP